MTRNKKLVKLMALAVAASTVATSVPAYAAFDATYYAQQNPDVVAAIGTKPADLETHYNVFGKKEGRAGSADEAGSALRQIFDAEFYAKMNPDVVAVLGNDANALFNHFLQFGIKEGRRINPYFDVNAYKKAYPDLVAAFGDDIAAYYNHFANHGISEHRTLGGFPAEKIVPGASVAYSGGSSSSSSSGGGGSSSKPATKPADEQKSPDQGKVDPTPDPTPQPTPTPDDGKQEESLPSEVEVAQAAIENATKKVEAELEKYDSENLPTEAEKAELVKSTKAIVDSSRELKDQTAQAANAAAAELSAAQAKLGSLQADLATGTAKTASINTANAIEFAAQKEVAVLQAQYNVEKAQAAYDDAVKARKEAQSAYDSAMDVARDLIKNVFNVDPSMYDSGKLVSGKENGSDVTEYGVAKTLNRLYAKSTLLPQNIKDYTLGDKLKKATTDGFFDNNGELLSGDTLVAQKKIYATNKVTGAKEKAVHALLDEYFDTNTPPTPARQSEILKELYYATATEFNEDGTVKTNSGALVKADISTGNVVTYSFVDAQGNLDPNVYADAAAAKAVFDGAAVAKGKVSGIDDEKVAAEATTEIETMISNYEKCQKADKNLTAVKKDSNNQDMTAEGVLEAAKLDEKRKQLDLNNANVVLNGGTAKKEATNNDTGLTAAQTQILNSGVTSANFDSIVITDTTKGENLDGIVTGAIKDKENADKAKNTAISVREATYAAEDLDGATLESLRAADAQAEVVADDVIASGKAAIAANKADKANAQAEDNWTDAKALRTQEDKENAQP